MSGICQHLFRLLTFQCHSQHYHSYYLLNGEALRHYIYLSGDAVGFNWEHFSSALDLEIQEAGKYLHVLLKWHL